MIKNHTDNWQEVKDSALTTIGKEDGKYPSSSWKTNILISEHSPIRLIKIKYIFRSIKSWIVGHFVRHKHGIEHYVQSQREDRIHINRDNKPQSSPVNYTFEANAQSIINISKVRLCYMAHKETIKKWKDFLIDLKEVEPEIESVCVPSCIYRCGCQEFNSCGMFNRFLEDYDLSITDISDIKNRYKIFKESIYGSLK